jgi:bifunctional non-homologous end joining protein LigD
MTRDAAASIPLVEPMLATAGPLPASLDGWALEVKWDGARVGRYLDRAGGLRLLTRNGNSATERFPELAELTALLPGRAAVLDGEIIATDEHGRPSFSRLQERLALRRPEAIATAARTRPVTLMVFDVPWLDGRSLAAMSYRGRREVLEMLPLDGTRVVVPHAWPGSAAAEALAWTDTQGLEGVIAKRLSSPYTPGERSKNWIKYKHLRTADVWIGGWTPTGKTVKSLLLGVPDAGPAVRRPRRHRIQRRRAQGPGRTARTPRRGHFPVHRARPGTLRTGPVGTPGPARRGRVPGVHARPEAASPRVAEAARQRERVSEWPPVSGRRDQAAGRGRRW